MPVKKTVKKTAAKKPARKRKSTAVPSAMTRNKSVEIERISNGFVVSTWTEKGRKAKFAPTKAEAKTVATSML